jgi:hypothetical protein
MFLEVYPRVQHCIFCVLLLFCASLLLGKLLLGKLLLGKLLLVGELLGKLLLVSFLLSRGSFLLCVDLFLRLRVRVVGVFDDVNGSDVRRPRETTTGTRHFEGVARRVKES